MSEAGTAAHGGPSPTPEQKGAVEQWRLARPEACPKAGRAVLGGCVPSSGCAASFSCECERTSTAGPAGEETGAEGPRETDSLKGRRPQCLLC